MLPMRFLAWLAGYTLMLLLELFILPRFLGASVPAVSAAVFVVGVAFQKFLPALAFTGWSGLLRDLIRPGLAPSHTVFFLFIFFIMQGALLSQRWDEPLRRLGAILAGLLSVPLAALADSFIGQVFFHSSLGHFGWADLASRQAPIEILFALTWFSLFSWCMLRWFARKRGVLVNRI